LKADEPGKKGAKERKKASPEVSFKKRNLKDQKANRPARFEMPDSNLQKIKGRNLKQKYPKTRESRKL